jgi:hypothetical protein
MARAGKRKEPANYIPDEAIQTSTEERKVPKVAKNDAPPVDEYSDEKIPPGTPSNDEVKSGAVDDEVLPG